MHNKILYFPKETDEAMTDGYTDTGPTDTSSDDFLPVRKHFACCTYRGLTNHFVASYVAVLVF